MKKTSTLSNVTTRLELIAKTVNQELFHNEIHDKIIFNVQSKGRKKCYGWLTKEKVWKVNGKKKEEFREINICSEHLDEPKQVVSTLIHEMVHAYNAERNIEDTATNGRHNKKFGNKAEQIGFKVEHSKRHGYAHTSIIPKSNLDKFVLNLNLKKGDFETVEKLELDIQKAQELFMEAGHQIKQNFRVSEHLNLPDRKIALEKNLKQYNNEYRKEEGKESFTFKIVKLQI